MFIYEIKNTKTGQVYIGQTTQNPLMRWNQHRNRLIIGTHSNYYLQTDWNNYGETVFEFSMIDNNATTLPELNYLEEYYLNEYDYTYNIRPGGNYTPMAEETKKKISKTLSQYKKTKKHRENLSHALKGIQRSDETKKKISEIKKGRTHSDETKIKMSKSHKGINTWAKGRKMSVEERQMRSEAQKRRYQKARQNG
jgi:group I intron endonuclease